jgi:N-acetylneuraminic acid mutarotase
MKRLVVCGLLVTFLSASAGGAATSPYLGPATWADARHGWAAHINDGACRPYWEGGDSVLCATEDGGRTWRRIFVGGNYIFEAVRTSRQAGIVSTGAWGHYEYWSRDNGKHWYRIALDGFEYGVIGSTVPHLAGRGTHLYYAHAPSNGTSGGRITISRLTPWPPPGPAECAGPWSRSVLGWPEHATPVHETGNICLGQPVDAGTRGSVVLTLEGVLWRLAPLPDGFFALYQPSGADAPLTAVVHRNGATLTRELPRPSFDVLMYPGDLRVETDWPSIALVWRYFTPDERVSEEVVWRSNDGGASWMKSQRLGWTTKSRIPIERAGTAAGVVGKEIVLVGGYVRGRQWASYRTMRVTRAVHAYLPARDRWRRLPDLPANLTWAAVASTGKELYVVGGFDRVGRARNEAYVLRSGRWHRLPAAPERRAAAGAAIVGGKLYVVGGIGRRGLARKALVLDLESRRWSTAPGARPRAYLGVTAEGGRIVALGGSTAGPETSLALVESWRPGDRSWRRLPPLPSPRTRLAATSAGGRVFVVGGTADRHYVPLPRAAALHLSSGRWESLPDFSVPRHDLSAAVVGRRLYALAGGFIGQRDPSAANESLLVSR